MVKETTVYDDCTGIVTKTISGDANSPDIVTKTYTDLMGRPTKTSRVLNGTEYFDTYTYDKAGNHVEKKTAYTAGLNGIYTERYTYDYANRLLSVTDALGNVSSVSYDRLGNLSTATDANGNTTLYTCDVLGRQLKVQTPFEQADSAIC